ncbi:MAG: VWA domain-containing protein [Clostridia bacterium]|nr:VWA domain-containing protein [Clostridia bacterium]
MATILEEGKKGVTSICSNVIFLLDTSGSMYGERINQLNYGMNETLNALIDVSLKQETDIYVRVVEFNSDIKWIIGSADKGVEIESASKQWRNLTANGGTDTAGAIGESLKALRTEYIGLRNKKPVVILITDGESNDRHATELASDKLKKAMSGSSGKEKIIRVAVGVQDYNAQELEYFASRGNVKDETGMHENVPFVFGVDSVEKVASVIQNVTVSSLYSATQTGAVALENDDSGATLVRQDKDDEPVIIDTTGKTEESWDDN